MNFIATIHRVTQPSRTLKGSMTLRTLRLTRSTLLVLTFAAAPVWLSPAWLHAQDTKIWSQASYAALERGTPDGVAITSDGALLPTAAAKDILTTPAAYVWSVAVDGKGNAYVGTGSPATVLKITPDGKSTRLLETKDLSVQVVRMGPDGMLYAATLPHGKVYRIDPNVVPTANPKATSAQPPVVFDSAALDTKPTYIWDMTFDAAGRLYIATGGPAAVYRVDLKHAEAKPETFFTSQEQHIRCLLFGNDGNLYAGSDGRGLVYRITPDGKGFVLFESVHREIPALAFDPAGNLYVASLGDKHSSNLPPLTTHSGPTVTTTVTILLPGSIQSSNDNALVPEGSEIDQLTPDGAPRQLWASKNDVLYSLVWSGDSSGDSAGLLATTGNQGHLYRIAADGTFADVAHLEARQATALTLATDGSAYVVTSNTGKLYHLESLTTTAAKNAASTYTSEIFDAKFFSHWGRAAVRASGSYDLFARSGNVEQPEQGWSEWKKVAPNAEPLPVPAARFVQWKAVLHAASDIESVDLAYLPQNVAPAVDAVVVHLHARIQEAFNLPQPPTVSITLPSEASNSGISYNADGASSPLTALRTRAWATVRWAAHDDNGDHLRYILLERAEGESNWLPLAKNLQQDFASFDMQQLPDGWYRLRVVASDALSNPPGAALTGYKDSAPFLVDTTPPVLASITAHAEASGIHVTFDATDALSRIARAYVSIDAGSWQLIDPVGQLSDAPAEHYDSVVPLPKQAADATQPGTSANPQQHVVAVRVFDGADNAAIAKTTVQEKD